MNTCPNCFKPILEDKPFCPNCGYKLDDSGLLYHYTSIDTLNAILSNVKLANPKGSVPDSLDNHIFTLRATHWMFFNDPLEYKFFFNKLIQFFENDADLKSYTEALKTAIFMTSNFTGSPYIISLSKNRDELDMWRSYSKNGTGVALGLSSDCIDHICNKSPFHKDKMFDCRYLDDDTLKTEFEGLKGFFLDVFSKSDIQLNSFGPLLEAFAVFKHPCYISEREKRIVAFDSTPNSGDSKYRVSNGLDIPFIEISLPISIIKEIIIGPCANKDLNKIGIQMQLASISHLTSGIPIKYSDLPYRLV